MNPDENQQDLQRRYSRWRERTDSLPERKPKYTTPSQIGVDRVYTPGDATGTDYRKDVGLPGEYPYLRGVHPTGYRGRLWTMRMFAGFGLPEETNHRFKRLLDQGQTGLSVAFDMPTLYGYDTDDQRAAGEYGKCGVAVSSLADMEALFQGISLDQITTSMTINAPAAIIWAMYIAVGAKARSPLIGIGRDDPERHIEGVHRSKRVRFPSGPVNAAGG